MFRKQLTFTGFIFCPSRKTILISEPSNGTLVNPKWMYLRPLTTHPYLIKKCIMETFISVYQLFHDRRVTGSFVFVCTVDFKWIYLYPSYSSKVQRLLLKTTEKTGEEVLIEVMALPPLVDTMNDNGHTLGLYYTILQQVMSSYK